MFLLFGLSFGLLRTSIKFKCFTNVDIEDTSIHQLLKTRLSFVSYVTKFPYTHTHRLQDKFVFIKMRI